MKPSLITLLIALCIEIRLRECHRRQGPCIITDEKEMHFAFGFGEAACL